MKASTRRITKIEMYAHANLIPVSEVLDFFEATIALFRSWEATTPAAHDVVLMVEWFTDPLRTGDMMEFQRRGAEWRRLDEEQRLELLRKVEVAVQRSTETL